MITLFLAVEGAFAQTGDTGPVPPTTTPPADTGETSDTGGPAYDTYDTGYTYACTDCAGAANLAGDDGGSPCSEGCSSTGAGLPGALIVAPALGVAARRRARSLSPATRGARPGAE